MKRVPFNSFLMRIPRCMTTLRFGPLGIQNGRHPSTVRQNIETLAVHLQVEQIRPLAFAVARHFSIEEADKAFRLFVSWSVRFLFFGGRGGMLDTQYSNRAQDVGTGKITKARELREAMSNYVPSDAQFEEAFSTARVSRAHLARYYLRALRSAQERSAPRICSQRGCGRC